MTENKSKGCQAFGTKEVSGITAWSSKSLREFRLETKSFFGHVKIETHLIINRRCQEHLDI